jgi:acyl-CoA thioesterase I
MVRKIGPVGLVAALVWSAPADGQSLGGTRSATPTDPGTHGTSVAPSDDRPVLMFFGTSLSAGLGLEPDQAYPALVQRRIDAAGFRYRVVNAGVSGATSADGVRQIDWVLRQPVAIFVLELGANDVLRGQDLAATRHNLQAILDRVRRKDPWVRLVIAGMRAPPNLGHHYAEQFHALFGALARGNHAVLIDFLLAGVAGIDSLNQSDGLHPNAAGARRVADTVWRVLEPVLRSCAQQRGSCEPVRAR